MKPYFFAGLLAVVALVIGFGAGASTSETPSEAVEEIIRLYETQDFDALIRTRYAEIHKAEDEEQIQDLVSRFERRFSDADRRNEAVEIYRSLLSMSPEISEDGTVATYDLDGAFVRLSRMSDGKWGFHL